MPHAVFGNYRSTRDIVRCREGEAVNAARLMRISPFKVILAGLLLAVAAGVLVLTLVAVEKPAEAAFPGENGRIAFVGASHNNTWSQIYTMLPDGTDVTQLTNDAPPIYSTMPTWSPDGTKLAVIRVSLDGSTFDEIWVLDIENGQETRLYDHGAPSQIIDLAWSPDGTKLAFSVLDDPYSQCGDIYVIDSADGSGLTNLTNTPQCEQHFDWSPRGDQIVFTNWAGPTDDSPDLWVMDADGSNRTELYVPPTSVGSPDWSPDGTRIVFSVYNLETAFNDLDIYVINADGSGLTNLTNTASTPQKAEIEVDPAWSPDGTKIVYYSYTDITDDQGNSVFTDSIYVMNADGANKTPLNISGGCPTGNPSPAPQTLPARPNASEVATRTLASRTRGCA
jgi:Tol biopolymer transport system component